MKNVTVPGRKEENIGFFSLYYNHYYCHNYLYWREFFFWVFFPSSYQLVLEEGHSLFFLYFFLSVCFSKMISSKVRSLAVDCSTAACSCQHLLIFFKQHQYDGGEGRMPQWKPYWNALLKTNLLFCFFLYHSNTQNNAAGKEGLNSRQILFCGLLN